MKDYASWPHGAYQQLQEAIIFKDGTKSFYDRLYCIGNKTTGQSKVLKLSVSDSGYSESEWR